MKTERQKKVLEIIAASRVATQQELVRELERHGFEATQSSVSRDIDELGLTKLHGYYIGPRAALDGTPVMAIDTAGDNLIVIRTDIGQATSTALVIDRANIEGIVGTVAGDDTLFVAIKGADAQRIVMKRIVKLFAIPQPAPDGNSGEPARRVRPARPNSAVR